MLQRLRQELGGLLVAIKGPSTTSIVVGDVEYASELMRPSELPDSDVGITSRRIVYKTVYKRSWIPDSSHTLYVVQGHAPEAIAATLDRRLFEEMTYPLLCSKLLEWSPFPHYYAIRAYLDRLEIS